MGRTSVALSAGRTSGTVLTKWLNAGEPQAEGLIPLISAVMADGSLDFSELGRVAVCIGPGGFSGIRTGVAAARGIGLAAKIPVVGATSFAIMSAAFLRNQGENAPKIFGLAAPAGLNAVFCQIVESGLPEQEPIHTLEQAATTDFFSGKVACVAGPAASALSAAGLISVPAVAPDLAPDAATLVRIAGSLDPERDLPSPYYARPADARPQTGYAVDRKLD